MAAPFVQGHLRDSELTIEIRTECAHSKKPMHISVDCHLNYTVLQGGSQPLVFEPDIDGIDSNCELIGRAPDDMAQPGSAAQRLTETASSPSRLAARDGRGFLVTCGFLA